MFGVAQRARVFAQPGERRAAFGGFQRETLAQAAGEDGFAAVDAAPQNRIEKRQTGAGEKRPATIASRLPRPARKRLNFSYICRRRRRGARGGRPAAPAGADADIESSACMGVNPTRRRRFVIQFRSKSAGLVWRQTSPIMCAYQPKTKL
jgi:hypothetical protein